MKIAGLQKLTLIDYPGKIAATVFTEACNFRCPFCHNPELVLPEKFIENKLIDEQDFLDFLDLRKGKLDGVCITGGEPTVHSDLLAFIKKIKKKGFLVKLDTNGTNPSFLKKAFCEEALDFVAMDIKNSFNGYSKACGVSVDIEKIKKSINLIQNSGVGYEFRTTVVPMIHRESDLCAIADFLEGSKCFSIQKYRDEGKILDESLREKEIIEDIDIEKVKLYFEKRIKKVKVHE